METLICPTCGCSLVRLGISKEKIIRFRQFTDTKVIADALYHRARSKQEEEP